MDFLGLAQAIHDQFVTVGKAPVPFIAGMLAVFWAASKISYSYFDTQLKNAKSEIQIREAALQSYKDKLNGLTPDEAKFRIESLEQRLSQLHPHEKLPQGQWFNLPAGLCMLCVKGTGEITIEIENFDGSFRSQGPLPIEGPFQSLYPFLPGDRRAKISTSGKITAEIG